MPETAVMSDVLLTHSSFDLLFYSRTAIPFIGQLEGKGADSYRESSL